MANITDKAKPRLKNLDDLFLLNDGANPLEQAVPIIETQGSRAITPLAIERLTPFPGHPFRLYEDERLDDMVASIKANGVLVPIIVRMIDAVLEILAGHNRVNAARLAGLGEVPAIVFQNISDEDALVYVIETNLIQRSFSDMSHSEKAAVIALHHSKMFSQGKRNDILAQLELLEDSHSSEENETIPPLGERLNTVKKVGEMYSLSKNTVSRYIRVQFLIPALKNMLDDETLALRAAVALSFLKANEQELVADCMTRNSFSVDMKKADILRQFSDNGKLEPI